MFAMRRRKGAPEEGGENPLRTEASVRARGGGALVEEGFNVVCVGGGGCCLYFVWLEGTLLGKRRGGFRRGLSPLAIIKELSPPYKIKGLSPLAK